MESESIASKTVKRIMIIITVDLESQISEDEYQSFDIEKIIRVNEQYLRIDKVSVRSLYSSASTHLSHIR